MLIQPIVQQWHWLDQEGEDPKSQFRSLIDQMASELRPREVVGDEEENHAWTLFRADQVRSDRIPSDPADFTALHALQEDPDRREYFRIVTAPSGRRQMHYYAPVRATPSCLECHYHRTRGEEATHPGDLIGMAAVTLPLSENDRRLAWNNALLLSTAIATVFLAMAASWAIVRYVIVKPVLHLREVSDSISRGQLDRRAEILTGDEFEELSQAFNRMLRHLVTIQEELRQVNGELDSKVDQLAQANLQLYEMNHLKNDFLTTMTHELRTPLNSILGFSDVLAGSDNLTDRQLRYLRNIQTSGKDLLTLINDILDLAKIEAGKMDLHPVEFAMSDLMERLTSMMRPLAERKNIELVCHCAPTLPVLHQDAGKLQQILFNLLSNAVKFTPDGGRVQVLAELAEPNSIDLIVEDTGVGIPLEDQDSIFEKFRQGNTTPGSRTNSLTREFAGTGLGLSIVRELTKLLGGEVSLVSELGKGSRFTVRVPCSLPEEHPLGELLAGPADSTRQSLGERVTPLPRSLSESDG